MTDTKKSWFERIKETIQSGNEDRKISSFQKKVLDLIDRNKAKLHREISDLSEELEDKKETLEKEYILHISTDRLDSNENRKQYAIEFLQGLINRQDAIDTIQKSIDDKKEEIAGLEKAGKLLK